MRTLRGSWSLALVVGGLLACSRSERAPSSVASPTPTSAATAIGATPGAAPPEVAEPAPMGQQKKPSESKTSNKADRGGVGGSVQAGTAQISGSLAPEVIQRVVRQSFDQVQACYAEGLRANPTLQGRVSIKLVIGKNGRAKSAAVASSDLADKQVSTCVAAVFSKLSFPEPERDEVTVLYPVMFSPGEP